MVPANRCIVFLLLAGILAQINCVAVYYGLFSMNRKAIAATACEKRVKGCCGRCFLHKKIASVDESRQQDPVDKNSSNKSQPPLPEPMPGLEPACNLLPLPGMRNLPLKVPHSMALAEGQYPRIDQPPEYLSTYTAA